jgi:plasmid stabilization system protein ParE
MTYRLIISDRAKRDRDRAFDWYRDHYSPEFAARWYDGICDAVDSLARDPMRCHKARESECFPFELHEILCGTGRHKHRILFALENDVISILHIRHTSQRDLTSDDL